MRSVNMNIYKEKAKVLAQREIAEGIYDMTLSFPAGAGAARPGQFIAMYCNDASRLLPRPISICEVDQAAGTLRVVYRIAGGGTAEFSALSAGDWLEVMGPLGNGFTHREGRAILIGGGIGIPPMLALAKSLPGEKTVVLGYRDELFLKEEFDQIEGVTEVAVATESGRTGTKGTVLDALAEQKITGDVIYACGPLPMLQAVAAYALEHDMEAQISLEERMACGIGACLGCITKTKNRDSHTNVHNKRICKDGPGFDAKEVDFS